MRKSFLVLLLAGLLVVSLVTAGCPAPAPPAPTPTLPPDARLVSLFFDDSWKNQYDVALPILLMHGFKASFAVITDYIGTGEGFWEYMSLKEIKELAEHGMDIAAHTKTHPDLTRLTDEQMREEILGSKEHLTRLGFTVRTFVYPYGAYNETVVDYVREAGYICARRLNWEAHYLTTTDPDARYRVSAWAITNQTFNEFRQIVDQAGGDYVVVLVYHFISDVGPVETSTPVANFAQQMRYLKEAGFTVVLLPDLFE